MVKEVKVAEARKHFEEKVFVEVNNRFFVGIKKGFKNVETHCKLYTGGPPYMRSLYLQFCVYSTENWPLF